MLAYVFWHRPRVDVDPAAYDAGLLGLHASLAATPPPGFRGSASFARAELPFFDGYEDWYLIDDWTALGVLNDHAVSSPHLAPHDAVAHRADAGAGAVFALTRGTPDFDAARTATYSEEPVPGDVTWRRQLVLGPAPQYIAHSAEGCAERGASALQRAVELVQQR